MNQFYISLYQQSKSIPISSILDHFKVKYDKNFDSLISCPIPAHIHKSYTPSFKVYKETNSFYCFGCKAAGGPAQLTQAMLGARTLEEALDYLEKNFNLFAFSKVDAFKGALKRLKGELKEVPEVAVSSLVLSFSKTFHSFKELDLSPQQRKILNLHLALIFNKLHYKVTLFMDNSSSRGSLEQECDNLLSYLQNLFLKWQKLSVKDAENL